MLKIVIHRTVAVSLAAVLTLAMFGGIDQLAQNDEQPAQWAQHTTARG